MLFYLFYVSNHCACVLIIGSHTYVYNILHRPIPLFSLFVLCTTNNNLKYRSQCHCTNIMYNDIGVHNNRPTQGTIVSKFLNQPFVHAVSVELMAARQFRNGQLPCDSRRRRSIRRTGLCYQPYLRKPIPGQRGCCRCSCRRRCCRC